jgi:hypothetical protein
MSISTVLGLLNLTPKICFLRFMPCSHAVAVAIAVARADVAAKQRLDTLRARPQKSVFLGHFAKKPTPNPILCFLSYFLNRFKRVLKLTLASLISCV